ncbi:helix-turn-helix domain-containing protein [Paenibacillus sp. FSL F4-0125]|uniref:helix-turn-helix domain-containing protein n=1 Tax=Paenibacillus sp. FSL F4-0125 TaxID=2954730 RepID=UPI0030F9CCB5
MNKESSIPFEYLFKTIFHNEISQMVKDLHEPPQLTHKNYLTITEVSAMSGIGTYTLRQLTFARAMPHRKVKSRIIFDQIEIMDTIDNFKNRGWHDPDKDWDISRVQSQIDSFHKKKEEPPLIEDIFRSLVKEELAVFSKEILNYTKKDRESYYGRTVLTIKEASKHFRTSPATIYSLIKDEGMPHFKIQSRFYIVLEEAEAYLWRETAKSYAIQGNIYWQRILQQLDWEESERKSAYERALKRLEDKY